MPAVTSTKVPAVARVSTKVRIKRSGHCFNMLALLQNRAAGFAMRIKSLAFGSAYSSYHTAAVGGAAAKDKNTSYIFSLFFFFLAFGSAYGSCHIAGGGGGDAAAKDKNNGLFI